jgi:acetylornithine/N-succinyldiaminopimelate aminotransferase
MIEAAEKITKMSGMDQVFFTNSGAEAIEGAIKVAKKYAYKRDGHAGHEVVAMQHSFHGRTVGALSATGTDHYREPFYPLMGGVSFAEFNDFDSVKKAVNENTCAILLEPVQGEGGIYPADPEFLQEVRGL